MSRFPCSAACRYASRPIFEIVRGMHPKRCGMVPWKMPHRLIPTRYRTRSYLASDTDLASAWLEALRELTGRRPLSVGPGIKTGIRMKYRDPAEVGADRIADLAAVLGDYEPPAIVVDLGTTTNFEVIDADGVFLGGIIAPGMALGARSLADRAAKLPVIDIVAPKAVIGTCTREAMQSGVVLGEIARIDGLLAMIEREQPAEYSIIVTGSNAAAVAPLLDHDATADATLTLRGLARLHSLNRR